jgi:hypothetical protein
MKTVKRAIWLIAGALMLLSVFPAASQQLYPDLLDADISAISPLTDDKLQEFLENWNPVSPGSLEVDEAAELLKRLAADTPGISQLKGVVELQDLQYRSAASDSGRTFSIVTDPGQSPLYRFSYAPNPNVQPPSGIFYQSHTFGLGAELSQALPTGGTLDLSLNNTGTASRALGTSSWSWIQSPSLSVSLGQPLGAGDALIDPQLKTKQLKSLELSRELSMLNSEMNERQLILQGLSLVSLHQSLSENLWVQQQRIELAEQRMEQLEADLELGVISRSRVTEQMLELEQLLLSRAEIAYEIRSLLASLEERFGAYEYEQLQLRSSLEELTEVRSFYQGKLLYDAEGSAEFLENDNGYQSAKVEYERAMINSSLGGMADAPRLGLSLSYEPNYANSTGLTVSESFTKLFSDDPSLFLTVTFQAPDLLRKESRLNDQLSEIQVRQADAKVDEQKTRVFTYIKQLQIDIDRAEAGLRIAMAEYQLSNDALEEEMIRFRADDSSRTLLRQKEIDRYDAAFSVLEHLRELELLSFEIDLYRN